MPVPVCRIPGWLFIALCFGTSVLTETDPEFSQCRQSFYKQTPPAEFSGGALQPRCHGLGAGQFASVYSTSCDTAVFSAFCLRKSWRGHSQEEDGTEDGQTGTGGKESQTEEDDVPVTTPALLRRDGYNIYTSSDTPANSWDALVSELVQNSIHPQCASFGGDLYVLTGRGSVGELGQGCELGLLWAAMCCEVSDEEAVFSLGVVNEPGEEARVLDVKGLEEVVGVGGVFFGGCGEADGGGGEGVITFALFQNALHQIVEIHNTNTVPVSSDTLAENGIQPDSSDVLAESATQAESSETQADTYDSLAESATQAESSDTQADSYDSLTESATQAESATQEDSSDTLAESATQEDSSDTLAESATQEDSDTLAESATQADSSDTLAESATQEDSDTLAESATQADSSDTLAERASLADSADVRAESSDAASEDAEEGGAAVQSRHSASPRPDAHGNSTLRTVLSWSLWLVTTPVRPVTSTLTQIPGQVTHVIREDLAVLSTLPGVTFSLLYNVVADAGWGAMSAAGLVGKAGSACASRLYSCTSPLVGTLLSTCQDGVTGVGTLTCDGVGILGGVANRAWSVSKYFGGRAWEQSRDFLWAVLSELGSQSKRAGGGLGKLVVKGGKGVVNSVCMAGRVVRGVVTVVVELVKEVFEDD